MKQVHVVCAILQKGNTILIAQRKSGEFAGLWEFPGGKIEGNETHEDALRRELREELDVEILIDEYFMTRTYQYASFHLTMECYLCRLASEELILHDHAAVRWIELSAAAEVDWIPADILIFERLLARHKA